jgi:transposase
LPWAAHHVTLVYRQRRIICRHCGIRTERIEFADPKARVTRRLRQQLRQDRREVTATALLTQDLSARQRAAITVCTDTHRPYLNAVGTILSHAEVVFDKFHVLQHAGAASDSCCCRRWKTVRGSKRTDLQALFAAN